jgi:RND family efflux transporter MFP subunit
MDGRYPIMKRPLILIVVVAFLVALIGGFSYFQFVVKPELVKGFISAGGQPPVTVETETAKSEQWLPKLPAIGTLRAVQGVDIASEVGGIVREINFDSGNLVTEGTVLVKLDDAVEQADLESGEAQLRLSELDLKRQEELLRRKNTSQTAYDTARATRDTAAAVVARVKAIIQQKSIKAAFGGRLGIRNVDVGQYVSPGDSMVTLQRLSPIYVDFPVPEQELAKLTVGVKVEVAVDSEPGRRFEGEVESVDAKVNQATRNVLVRARIENRDARLLPGMYADVDVVSGDAQKVVTLPRTAVTYSLYGDSVYVVVEAPAEKSAGGQGQTAAGNRDKNLIVDRRFVRVGETRGDRVSILEGVKAGEQVVVAGQIKLRPKAHVVVDNSDPLKPPAKRPLE